MTAPFSRRACPPRSPVDPVPPRRASPPAKRAVALSLALLAGCGEATPPVHSAVVRSVVTPTDPHLGTPDYWWHQPPVASVDAADFTRLWDACEAETRARFLLLDRQDYREGLLTTAPMVSAQVFEPWRTDDVTLHDAEESTLATIRRTVHFEIAHDPGGTYRMVPKVLVERYASAERRLTAINQYITAFSGRRAYADTADQSGDATAQDAVADYWYPLHRDGALERDLADSVRRRLRG